MGDLRLTIGRFTASCLLRPYTADRAGEWAASGCGAGAEEYKIFVTIDRYQNNVLTLYTIKNLLIEVWEGLQT